MVSEDSLLESNGMHGYATQMILKVKKKVLRAFIKSDTLQLLVAELVLTDFYLTLDADVLCVRKFHWDELLQNWSRAIYTPEPRYIEREGWWSESEAMLQVSRTEVPDGVTGLFGVTPAVSFLWCKPESHQHRGYRYCPFRWLWRL